MPIEASHEHLVNSHGPMGLKLPTTHDFELRRVCPTSRVNPVSWESVGLWVFVNVQHQPVTNVYFMEDEGMGAVVRSGTGNVISSGTRHRRWYGR